jgi:hypothetical protein
MKEPRSWQRPGVRTRSTIILFLVGGGIIWLITRKAPTAFETLAGVSFLVCSYFDEKIDALGETLEDEINDLRSAAHSES